MVFYLIGLGLGSPDDITVKGLNALKTCSFVFLEHYTSILCDTTTEELENYYNEHLLQDKKIKIILADRHTVEQNSDKMLNTHGCIDNNTAFLVVGDPFAATTHTDLLLRAAKEKNIECEVIHNASIMNAVSCCGLQLYSFGATVSIPFWTEKWKPSSFYDKIKKNKDIGLHTLCLLDIKVKEISEENMIKGVMKYEPPRFMTINVCIEQLLQIEKDKGQNVYNENTMCVALARIGSKTQQVVYGEMKDLMNVDFGKPLHSFVIPGDTHFIEEDVLKMYALLVNDGSANDVNDDNKSDGSDANDDKKIKDVWNGTDFNGIWQLTKSEQLEEYLVSEGWNDVMRKAAMKSKITQQIIQNEDAMKIKIFSSKGNCSYSMIIDGDCVQYKDVNGDLCESLAKWSEDKKYIIETVCSESKLSEEKKEYQIIRRLADNDQKQMTLKYVNDKGVSVMRYFAKR